MSVRNPNYQQVHDLYELCSNGTSLTEFCRMSGVSYQKYREWQRSQNLAKPSEKIKPDPEPVMGTVTISDAPSTQPHTKSNDRPIREFNVRLSNGTSLTMRNVSLEDSISMLRKILS